ncbi:MFS transporter [Ignavibacteria bacterium 4148-Me]|uniref:MFS transporter n=1 Tax=Rosettibacter primus TaxID=3111523 RepID=UPI00336BF1DD
MKTRTFPIYLIFLCMGFGDVVGPLVGLAKESFTLSYTMAQLIPFTGFIMYGLLSIPVGIIQDRVGKKIVLRIGLITALTGLFLAIASGLYGNNIFYTNKNTLDFFLLLITIVSLCAGATILQVVGNPIVYDVSPEGKYSKNLSLAQFYKSIGSSIGFILPPIAAIYLNLDWSILFPVFAALVLLTFISVQQLQINDTKLERKHATFNSCFSLLKEKYVALMVIAIFLYVGAEVSMSSGIPIYLKEYMGISDYSLWLSWSLFFLPLVIGRYSGAKILNKIHARKFFLITTSLSIIGLCLLFTSKEYLVYSGIIIVGFGFANIFPLIFSLVIEKFPSRSNELSGLMITAISGGAIVPLIMGKISDMKSLLIGFTVPLICLLYILITAIISYKKSQL